jgi:FkbM family methyltransferase
MFPVGSKRMGFEMYHPERGTATFLYREIFARQHYFFSTKKPSPVVFDCGANVGVAAMYFKWLYPDARVHCFEADPGTFTVLKQNIGSNHLKRVTAEHCALWDENGEIDFYNDPNRPSMLHMSTDSARVKGHHCVVPSRCLSDFIDEPVDFLKMDVEGAEQRVLNDLVRSGKVSLIRQMVIEYHHHLGAAESRMAAFLKTLEECGFEYQINAQLYPVSRTGEFQDVLIGCYRPHANGNL